MKDKVKLNSILLRSLEFNTPLGPMIAIANEDQLILLEFVERQNLARHIQRLQQRMKSTITPGITAPIASIQAELARYFKGELRLFKTPLYQSGTPFQHRVWTSLTHIPYGKTQSYLEQATMLQHPTAARAVANANAANQHAIVIPCHRVIHTNGSLGGYAAGIARKQWLIHHERQTG